MKPWRSICVALAALGFIAAMPVPDFHGLIGTPAKAADAGVAATACPPAAVLSPATMAERMPYDVAYDAVVPSIAYGSTPVSNRIARLEAKFEAGKLNLPKVDGRGYLDAILGELGIDRSSQILVYSRSSLQVARIKAATPRAIYFNDDTYVAWVPGTQILEIATMDCQKGAVFYTLDNTGADSKKLTRQVNGCLLCHDSVGLAGGGVPLFMASSIPSTTEGSPLRPSIYNVINDQTALEKRWGGWYVTGKSGKQTHMGNLLVQSQAELDAADHTKAANLDSAGTLFDAKPYLSDKSDIVALMVFEHQTSVQNAIITANFRTRSVLTRQLGEDKMDTPWADLSPDVQQRLVRQIEPAVDALLFSKAIHLTDKIAGGSGFETGFEARGVRDASGRSLRDLDLETRLFRYPVSYEIYSEGFDGLPRPVREYIYKRITEVLQGKDTSDKFVGQAENQRQAALDILKATKPDFARVAAAS